MARNSEIVRAGMERRVVELATSGSIPPRIAETVSNESGHTISTASVRRHLAKNSLNSVISPERQGMEVLAAAISGLADERDTDVSSYFGTYKLNTANNFTQYYGIARGIGNGQVMRAFKNIALKITNGARIVGDEKDADKIELLVSAINFSSLLQNVVRYTCEMGTCLIGLKTDDAYITPSILPMQYYTLLTDSETPGTVTARLVHGTVTKIVFDEGGDDHKTFTREEVGLLRLWADSNEMKDISGRDTFGIYGESMTTGVETPLKSLLNSSYFFDAFIRDYGLGRYVYNMKLLADLVQDKTITPSSAEASRDKTIAAMQKMGANEDIITVGDDIRMLESRTGFDIVPYLEWRRKQIDRALLQSDVGTGDVGNAWTSSGAAVSAQDYDAYKSLRETLFDQFYREVVAPRCEDFGLDPDAVSITATPFLRVNVPFTDLTEWANMGLITETELRDRGGFSLVKPDEE